MSKLLKPFAAGALCLAFIGGAVDARAGTPAVQVVGEDTIYSLPSPPYKVTWSDEANQIANAQIALLKKQLQASMDTLKKAGATTMSVTYSKSSRVHVDSKIKVSLGFNNQIFTLNGLNASGNRVDSSFTHPSSIYPLANDLVHPKDASCSLTKLNTNLPQCSIVTPTPKEFNDGRLGEALSIGPQNVLAEGKYAAKQLENVLSRNLKYTVTNGVMTCAELAKPINGGLNTSVKLSYHGSLWGWSTKLNAKARTAVLTFNKPNLVQAALSAGLQPKG